MPLDPADLTTLSRLLDEALDLDPAQFEAWLKALPDEHRHLLPRLRDMLAARLAQGGATFLSHGPKLADAPDETVARAGELVGPYRLIRGIGRGGMGAVWLAERADGTLKRQVALKLPRLAWGAGLAERMARERDIGALLEHPHIARLYDAGVDAMGRPYLALEYIDGQSLDEWCEAHGCDIRARLRLFVQVVRAVAYAHGRLVVHRDLKPSNVLVTADGQAHLLDFGIAKLLHEAAPGDEKLTQEQGRVLTPHYASPEQIKGEPITVASDVYSLGVLLYELLTQRLPHSSESKSIASLEHAIVEGEPELASNKADDKPIAKSLRGELDAILVKALKREPEKRYATADALADDIERHLDGERVLAQPDSLAYRVAKALHKHRTGFAAAALVLVAVVGGAGVSLVQAKRANDAAERARVVKEFIVEIFKVNAADPQGNSELRQMPAEALLERGASLIETKFPGQPGLQAELYGVVGSIFVDMGSTDLATSYASRQVETLAATGASDAEQAKANFQSARALFIARRPKEAEIRARRALELGRSDPALRLQTLILLARALRYQGRYDEVFPLLTEAEVSASRIPGPTTESAWLKYLHAMTLFYTNRLDESLPHLQSAIEQALAVEGPRSQLATGIRRDFAIILFEYGRPLEARHYSEAALAGMRAIGGPADIHAASDEALFAIFMFEARFLSFAEAKAVIEHDRELLTGRRTIVPESASVGIDRLLGRLYLLWGDVVRAGPLMDHSFAAMSPLSEGFAADAEFFLHQASLARMLGQHDQADELLRRQMQHQVNVSGTRAPWAVGPYLWRAFNFDMTGRFKDAEEVLAMTTRLELPRSVADSVVPRMLARIRIDRGDAGSALAALPPENTDSTVGAHEIGDDYRLRGEILCQLGEREKGLRLIEDSLQREQARYYEHHPDLARGRAVAGLCALADGRRKRAEELAALARASFIAQPGVSPYFKRPSEKLDRLLAMPNTRTAQTASR